MPSLYVSVDILTYDNEAVGFRINFHILPVVKILTVIVALLLLIVYYAPLNVDYLGLN